MKDRPILPLVLSMSLPMVLSMTVASLYNIVDSYYVARISEDAMTALSLVLSLIHIFALPLKFADSDGAPVRALALLPEEF